MANRLSTSAKYQGVYAVGINYAESTGKIGGKWNAKVLSRRAVELASRKLSLDAFHFPRDTVKTLVSLPLRMHERGTHRSCDLSRLVERLLVSGVMAKQKGKTVEREGER